MDICNSIQHENRQLQEAFAYITIDDSASLDDLGYGIPAGLHSPLTDDTGMLVWLRRNIMVTVLFATENESIMVRKVLHEYICSCVLVEAQNPNKKKVLHR